MYNEALPSLRVKKNASQVIEDALKWGKWIAQNNTFHYGEYGNKAYITVNSKYYENGKYKPIYNVTHSCGCHFCGTEKKKKKDKATKLGYNGENWEYTYVCNTFVTAMYAHGGMIPAIYKKCSAGKCIGMSSNGRSSVLDKSKDWKYMGKIPMKDLKAGDILVTASHMQCVYAPISDKKVKIIESTSYIGKYKTSASNDSIRIKEKTPSYTSVYRFIGSIDADISIRYGEYTNRVVLWQKFLNYNGYNCGEADGKFGTKTLAATKEFQLKNKLTVDGIIGKNTLAKAEEIKTKINNTPEPTPTPAPQPVKKAYTGAFPDWTELSGNIIATTAKKLSHGLKVSKSKYTYGKGAPTPAFTAALKKVYPSRSKWSKQCQQGASCDVGAGTVLRYCGASANIPRGLEEQIPWLKQNTRFKDMKIASTNNWKPGDVGVYLNKKSGGHIWIYVGDGIIAEANHTGKYFEHLIKRKYTNSGFKYFACFRMTVPIRRYMERGDTGSEVLKLQKFLNWAGYDCGVADGDFGAKTESAVKAFQTAQGLKADGKFGDQSLEKAKLLKI